MQKISESTQMSNDMEHLLEIAESPRKLFDALQRMWVDERNKPDKTCTLLLIQLHEKHNFNFYKLAKEAIQDGFSPFNAADILAPAVVHMELNESTIVKFTEFLYERMAGDMMAERQFNLIENILNEKPAFARTLLTAFLNEDKPYVVRYISNIFTLLAVSSVAEIHHELCLLTNHTSCYVQIAAADALGKINYRPKSNRKLLKETFAIYGFLEKKDNEEIDRILVYAFNTLLAYSAKPKHKLEKLAGSTHISVKGAVAKILPALCGKYANEKWYWQSLLSLTNVSSDYKGVLLDIDYTLSKLLSGNRNLALAETYVTSWIVDCSDRGKQEKAPDIFSFAFHKVANDRRLLSNWVTKFFNSDCRELNSTAADIISYCLVHEIPAFPLDKEYLISLDINDCIYISRRILGYLYSIEYMCELCFSILDKSPRDKKLKELVFNVFGEHLGKDFAIRTIKFLNGVKGQTKSKNKLEIINQLITDLENRLSKRKALPLLSELIPSSRKTSILARESVKKMSLVMKEAEKRSVFLSITPKVQLKQGTGWFHFMNGAYSEISKMSQFSQEYEIPSSEIFHQVETSIQKLSFRNVKRGQS